MQHGNTPLHEASWKGYSRCVKLLCALPKTKPSSGGTGKSGLSLDLLKDATKIKHALHDTKGALHSALLGTRNFGGFSALHLAAQNGHNQSCREILLAGADPDVQNNVSIWKKETLKVGSGLNGTVFPFSSTVTHRCIPRAGTDMPVPFGSYCRPSVTLSGSI